ncbi:hypothetical protein HS088_TW11G00023 [Tripterygium wilfordii]|uniref:Uncharacterized protein n=1 Tax=Tripterygium wilfordii TaxID=458696 RepID=A0A7J7D0V4_TRIWF|nr:uncharacterized protein LOC120008419 [Tripterygium wilfordii]KAF5739961.1 hypothetical protein HS088_TW11G00023 [Tripterygium wilfordii]
MFYFLFVLIILFNSDLLRTQHWLVSFIHNRASECLSFLDSPLILLTSPHQLYRPISYSSRAIAQQIPSSRRPITGERRIPINVYCIPLHPEPRATYCNGFFNQYVTNKPQYLLLFGVRYCLLVAALDMLSKSTNYPLLTKPNIIWMRTTMMRKFHGEIRLQYGEIRKFLMGPQMVQSEIYLVICSVQVRLAQDKRWFNYKLTPILIGSTSSNGEVNKSLQIIDLSQEKLQSYLQQLVI